MHESVLEHKIYTSPRVISGIDERHKSWGLVKNEIRIATKRLNSISHAIETGS